MTQLILALGFRVADSARLEKEVNDILLRMNKVPPDLWYESFYTRQDLIDWLSKYAEEITDAQPFNTFTDYGYRKPYQSSQIDLFICTTHTKEASEHSEVLTDGEIFAHLILPRTPKLILHYESRDRKPIKFPDVENLLRDLFNQVYHLRRDISNIAPSVSKMEELISAFYQHDTLIPYRVYLDIVN